MRKSKNSRKKAREGSPAFLGFFFLHENLSKGILGGGTMKYLLAHDIGTSGDKAALFSADGHLIASKTVSYQTFYAQGGAIEQRPQDWWEAVC